MNRIQLLWLSAAALVLGGCVSGEITGSRRVDLDDESVDGGISSADIRTVAFKMGPEILSLPEIANGDQPVRIKISDVKNTSRFFIDRDLVAKRLRIELNRHGRGQVRFLDKNEKNQAARKQVLDDRREEQIKNEIRTLGREIAASPIFQTSPRPVKVAVIPVLNANLVNMNADSFTAMLRSEVVSAGAGKIQFLMPGHTEGADYWLTGQFYPESMKKEGIVNLAEYIEVVDARVKDGKSLYIESSATTSVTAYGSTHSSSNPREGIILEMLRNPELRKNPNVNKTLNVMIVKPSDKVSVYEKTVTLDRRFSDNSGRAAYVLSCEISAQSQARNGIASDYLMIGVSLLDPVSNETVWEDAYEVKRVSRAGTVYR